MAKSEMDGFLKARAGFSAKCSAARVANDRDGRSLSAVCIIVGVPDAQLPSEVLLLWSV